MTKDRSRILESIENFLVFMELSEVDKRSMKSKGATREHFFPLSGFKDVEPLVLGDDLVAAERTYLLSEQDPKKLAERINLCLLVDVSDPGDLFGCRWLRTMEMSETRGRIKPWTPHAVEERSVCVGHNGHYEGKHAIWGWTGSRWEDVKNFGSRAIDGDAGGNAVGIFSQHAIYREFLWHVSIGYVGSSASLMIPCDARSALELFKFRDIPQGKTRRDALVHWVSEHWRRKPTNPYEAVKVLEHLRGKTSFSWVNGLNVRISPALEDLKDLEKSKRRKA